MLSDMRSQQSPGILVVDDDPSVREILCEYLDCRGYSVVQAGDGVEALDRLAATPSVRLVISDVRMPIMSGLELAERIAELYPDLRIILISGYFQAQAMGARFLKKPFSMVQLEAVVQAELVAAPPT